MTTTVARCCALGSSAIALIALACILPACSGAPADGADGVDSDDSDLVGCSAQAKRDAKVRYDIALDLAKKRVGSPTSVCETGAVQSRIEEEVSLAVSICSNYERAIKSRASALPIRRALGDSLMLAYVTGALRPNDTWKGLADALPGVTLHGVGTGAFGSTIQITFGAKSKVTVRSLDVTRDAPTWVETAGSYALGTNESGGTITVTEPTGTFTLKLGTAGLGDSDASRVTAVPSGSAWEAHHGPALVLTSPSECEA